MKQVYEFKDGGKEMVALLGGKGCLLYTSDAADD